VSSKKPIPVSVSVTEGVPDSASGGSRTVMEGRGFSMVSSTVSDSPPSGEGLITESS